MTVDAVAAGPARTRGRLRLTEIFRSIQGEGLFAGLPTTFIRLTGCPLRCQYCDTAYAFHGGEYLGLDAILADERVRASGHVCVTGGEPLAQPACLQLLTALCDAGHSVSLETSGALDISPVDARVSRVVDLKTPGSAEVQRNLWSNIEVLTPRDQIKFVVCDRADFDWSVEQVKRLDLLERCPVFVSPSSAQVAARDLAEWVLASGLDLRMQVQLHKIIWEDARGR